MLVTLYKKPYGNGAAEMKDYRNNQYPEHDRTSCNDENLANVDPDGSGCRRCNALLFNRYEELLEEVQALRKDAGRMRRNTLLAVLGELNSNPYNLTKSECIDVVREMFEEADAAMEKQK